MIKQASIETVIIKKPKVEPKRKWREIDALKDKLKLDRLLDVYEYGKNYFDSVV